MKKFPYTLQTYLDQCQQMVDLAAYWASRAKHWAYIALTGVGIVEIEAGTTEITVGTEDDRFTYYIVNDDLNTVTFFLVSNPIPGTSFQIRNNGQGIVQVQALDDGIINSPGTSQLRSGTGALVSLVAVRAKSDEAEASWDMNGDIEPL